MAKKKHFLFDDPMVLEFARGAWKHPVVYIKPYEYVELEQAFWHLWTLNCYHVTLSFDANMTLLLDWALSYHLERGGK